MLIKEKFPHIMKYAYKVKFSETNETLENITDESTSLLIIKCPYCDNLIFRQPCSMVKDELYCFNCNNEL